MPSPSWNDPASGDLGPQQDLYTRPDAESGYARSRGREQDPPRIPRGLGILGGSYITSAPAAALGFFLGGMTGLGIAIAGNTLFWLLVALRWRKCYLLR
ncbi:MAG: hypothetical protein ABI456_19920 [Ktedonobacteraceae bacterium]|nr:hypothetical protein [Chloroflexota bacterium]